MANQTRIPTNNAIITTGRVITNNNEVKTVSRVIGAWEPNLVTSVTLRGWWRADQGITLGVGGGVAQWDDLSSNGNSWVQATDGYRPLYEPTGFQGLPSMKFDGTDDFLSNNALAAFFSGNDIPMTMYLVYELLSVTGVRVIWRIETTLASVPYTQHYMNGTQFVFDRNAAFINGTFVGAANTKYVHRVFFTGTTLTAIQNTSINVNNSSQNIAAITLNLFTLGASNQQNVPSFWSNIRVAEMFLFSARPTAAEDRLIIIYLNKRYNIQNG